MNTLPDLDSIWLGGNQISDISPLSNSHDLYDLRLDDNQISDISPLSNLTVLNWIGLNHNQIVDISPLLENFDMMDDGTIDLEHNPLSNEAINLHIPQLQAKGFDVYW